MPSQPTEKAGWIRVRVTAEDLRMLLKGEQPQGLIDAIERMQKDKEMEPA
jgi:hypothetical protein